MALLLDILKLLTDDQAKLWRASLTLLRFLFTLCFASWIYQCLHGNYNLVDFGDFSGIWNYMVSGRVILSLLYFTLSYWTLFQVLPQCFLFVLSIGARRLTKGNGVDREDGKIIISLLRFARTLDIQRRQGRVHLLENAELLYSIVHDLKENGKEAELHRLHQSLIAHITTTYLAFLLTYFLVIPAVYHKWIISFGVLGLGCFIVVLYFGLAKLMDVLDKVAADVVLMIKEARLRKQMVATFAANGLVLKEKETGGKTYDWQLYHAEEVWDIRFIPQHSPIPRIVQLIDIKRLVAQVEQHGRRCLLVTGLPVETEVVKFLDNTSDTKVELLLVTDRFAFDRGLQDWISWKFDILKEAR